jgi:hypothetical protein
MKRSRRVLIRAGTPEHFVWIASRKVTPAEAWDAYERLCTQGVYCMVESEDTFRFLGLPDKYEGYIT